MVATSPVAVSGAGTPGSPFNVAMAAGFLVPKYCTSATRPAGPSEGYVIWETDTDRLRVWDGVRWRLVSPHTAQADQQRQITSGTFDVTAATTICTFTITNPFDANDPFVADISAVCQFTSTNSTTGQQFDFHLVSGANTQSVRVAVAGNNGMAVHPPLRALSAGGGSITATLQAQVVSATDHTIGIPADIRFAQMRAKVHAA